MTLAGVLVFATFAILVLVGAALVRRQLRDAAIIRRAREDAHSFIEQQRRRAR